MERYIEENAEGKLYIRAEVEILPPLDGVINDDDWVDILEMWAWQIVEMSSMFRNEELSLLRSLLGSEIRVYSLFRVFSLVRLPFTVGFD